MIPRQRYHRPPVAMDRNSPDDDLQRIAGTMRDWVVTINQMGHPAELEIGALDAIEGLIVDRLRTETADTKRLLAFCFVVALRVSAEGGTDDDHE